MRKILIVDDDLSHRHMLATVLESEGYNLTLADDGTTAVDEVQEQFFDLIIMDLKMKQMNGIDAMVEIKKIHPATPIIIMTAYASVDTAVSALKMGAYDYLTKPVETEEMKIIVKKSLDHSLLEIENKFLKERLNNSFNSSGIIANGKAMSSLFESMAMVAPTEATVLITGESGTGKELIANAIHENSPRKDKPFVKVNCAALPENLLESELFGHMKGAFTGASENRKGRFQMAHMGSIFLDEIAEMPMSIQVKLLRVLQEKEFEPVGSSSTVKVDTRIITATNRNLEVEIEQGRFREDLFFRINVINLKVPPLRERRDDIPLLVDWFIKKYSEKNRRLIKGIIPHGLDLLMRYDWPGNVRELKNVIERAVIMSRGDVVSPSDFPVTIKKLDSDFKEHFDVMPIGKSLKEVEKEMILQTLEDIKGNRTKTADILGISRRTLQLKLKEYGINPKT